MIALQKILVNIDFTLAKGSIDFEINQIQDDSRKVKEKDVFVAVQGIRSDGHQYIDKAITLGAKVIVCETLPSQTEEDITYLLVKSSARVLGLMASNFYDNPSQKLKLVGVTGTNGKTTITTLAYKLFKKLGYRVGLISTVQNLVDEEVIEAKYTTPNPLELQALLAKMVERACSHCFMEVSSHGVTLERIAGLYFVGGAFSNISRDHLDFHKTFENYINAKKKFFDDLPKEAFALVNVDDRRGRIMLQNTKAKTQKTFALKNIADFKAKVLENTLQGLYLDINGQEAWFRLIGNFNAYNLLTVFGIAILLGEAEEVVLQELSALKSARGRFEQVPSPKGTMAIIDYSHTPDALENVLQTIFDLKQSGERIITIVGAGGNRDKGKRPEMAKIACQYSNQVIFTSDNPRDEEPMRIIEDMQKGIGMDCEEKVLIEENRQKAIQEAYKMARKRDIILIAGKGHETYQEIKGIRHDFDDRKVFEACFNKE